ncbi:ribonuclease HII [Parasphingorhabdus sp.]|uniref:ribonuclease HII n=1 Tax=Parasphingorhabdus sp. TaxID=2709688 RepID=UPI003264AC85
MIAGVDEAGRGPLAGPVVAGAVILPDNHAIVGLDDSKKLTAKKRERLEQEIMDVARFSVAQCTETEIDEINILQATMLAMKRAVEGLDAVPDHVLVDGNRLPQWSYSAEAVVGGDAIHACISAASILAKEYRDRMMIAAAEQYPQYGWERNKGYGTAEHLAALKQYGPTPLHRKSFAPIAQLDLL